MKNTVRGGVSPGSVRAYVQNLVCLRGHIFSFDI